MPPRDVLKQDLLTFLTEYAVMVNGGNVQQAVGGGTVGQLATAGGYTPTQRVGGGDARSGVSLTAALFSAALAQTRAAENGDLLDFSRPQVTINLGASVGGDDVPVYLIPYEGGKARGVKLPAHGTDGLPVAYAMTATQNGCTVEVSGDPASPYASHTNVIDVMTDVAQRWNAREQKINLRLFKLQQRFAQAEAAAGGDATAPGRNRTQFGFYAANAAGGVVAQHKNYNATMTAVADGADGQLGKTQRRESATPFAHYRYYCVPTDETVQDCRIRSLPPQALVIGRRDAGGWKFYYQVWRDMSFHVKRVLKVKGLALGDGEFLVDDADRRKKFFATVVMASGELWPNLTERACTFGLGI